MEAKAESSGRSYATGALLPRKKGKRAAYFAEAISREAKTATMPSPNAGAVTPSAILVLMSEATDGATSTVPLGTHEVPGTRLGLEHPAVLILFATELRDCP